MNKSQLRKLAREYAIGNLDEETYLHRRRMLVNDIVSGKVAIVREVPPPPRQAYSEDPTTIVSVGAREGLRRVTSAVLFIVLIIVSVIIWTALPPGQQPEPPQQAAQPAPVPPVSRARALIDEFVKEKDFSAFSIASFKESWSHLSYDEKREAYAAHWFNDLINLISDEIKTQNALVGSDPSSTAAETGRRLSDFAVFLGVTEYVTEFNNAPEPGVTVTTAIDANAAAVTSQNPAAELPTRADLKPAASRTTLAATSYTEWLAAQPESSYTLQLFAVNQLDKIQNLIAAHPQAELKVLVSAEYEPRYRVVHGIFDTEDAARSAYERLPADIRTAQPVPLVKSISGMRADAGVKDKVASLDGGKYTLQVFATDSVDSARRLQSDYPSLDLNLLETTHQYSRFRVLYGSFDSEDMARKAAGGLPAELLRDVGDPLVKPVSELQQMKR